MRNSFRRLSFEFRKLPARQIAVVFLSVLGIATTATAGDIPLQYLGFRMIPGLHSRSVDALLLTPEQKTQLEAAWNPAGEVYLKLIQARENAPSTLRQEFYTALSVFTEKRDLILTEEQRSVRDLICDIADAANKSATAEYSGAIDAASTQEEKVALVAERDKLQRTMFFDELKNSLAPERLSALMASEKK